MKTTRIHSRWEFAEKGSEDKTGWLPARVPGHVHLDLVRNGVLADPFYRMQEFGARWVDEAAWIYRTQFEWMPDPSLPRRILRFEGLDSVCTVSLNGRQIGSFDNMFLSHDVDVSDLLVPGANALHIQFEPAQTVGAERRSAYFAAQGLADDVACFGPRSFVRKAQYMFGWDWGPCLISCGIWRPIELLEFESRLLDVHAQAAQKDGAWKVSVSSEQEGPGAPVHRLIDPSGSLIREWEGDGESEISNPQLWHPHDLGGQPLYRLISSLGGSEIEKRIGLRTIRLIREDDALGQSFQFEVNGMPVWARGANWIPDHSFPSIVSRKQVFDQLTKAKAMGMNMLRVWGGGLYESDDFYDAADELGILIWQDFAYGCAYYPDTEEWQAAARLEAEQNVKRLRHRASLAHWCGNNENLTMWHHSWGGTEHRPPRYYGEHIYDEVIPSVLAELDPNRSYTSSSPWGGEEDCNQGGIGDQHYWDVWHGGDWTKYAKSGARFCSEFGFASSPSLAVWDGCLAAEDHDPRSPAVKWHDKTGKGYDTYFGYVGLHYPEIATLEDLVYFSQLNQRDAIRYAVERYRGGEFCKGALIWQINDCWPVQSWAILDHLGRRKALGFELERTFAPRLITIENQGGTLRIIAANDGREDWEYEVRVLGIGPKGESRLDCLLGKASVPGFSRVCVGKVDVSSLPVADTLIWASTEGVRPAWTLLTEPKDSTFCASPIQAAVSGERLTLTSSGPVVDLWLHAADVGIEFSPNYVTWPGGSASVCFSGDLKGLKARSLAGEHELIEN